MPWDSRTIFNKEFRFSEEFRKKAQEKPRRKFRAGYQPIVHREKRIKLLWPLDPSLRNKFKCPENLTIVTVSTYPEKSIFEQSLDFLGITDYVVLSKPIKTQWRHTYKIEWILEFLQSRRCKTEYLLYCDARDTILVDDPHKILDIFETMYGELIFSSTVSKKGIFHRMPQLLDWTRTVAQKNSKYLNAGTFVGKTKFIQQVFESAITLIGKFSRPYSDQDILRYLRPVFYPEMNIDYFNKIFYRN